MFFRDGSVLRKLMSRRSGAAVSEWVSRALGHTVVSPAAAIHIAAADEYSMSEWLEALLNVFCQRQVIKNYALPLINMRNAGKSAGFIRRLVRILRLAMQTVSSQNTTPMTLRQFCT